MSNPNEVPDSTPMLSAGVDMSVIAPAKGSKFSPNLYKWLSHSHRSKTSRVFKDDKGDLWIGMLLSGEFLGARLISVLCNGHKEASHCWLGLSRMQEVQDFWVAYERGGRCAMDPDHQQYFIGDDNRWSVSGDSRSCQWCGVSQILVRWTETVERSEWRAPRICNSAAGL